MEKDNPSSEEAVRIGEQLVSSDEHVRILAEQALRQMGPTGVEAVFVLRKNSPETVQVILRLLENERLRRRRFLRYYWLVGLPLFIALLLLMPGEESHQRIASKFLLLLGSIGIGALGYVETPYEAALSRLLSQFDDPHIIGPLLETLTFIGNESDHAVIAALTRLLPRLRTTDTDLLNDRQRDQLYRTLEWFTSGITPDFYIAVLKALEQIGDEKAIPRVEKIAKGEVPVVDSVRRAAEECLPYLRERARQAQESSRLLRPAPPPDNAAAVLLRPAHGGSEAHPERLLRPVGEEGGLPYVEE